MRTLCLCLLVLAGCARDFRSVPVALVDRAVVPGLPHVRAWGDDVATVLGASFARAAEQERAYWQAHPGVARSATVDVLTLSGGGEAGAFGAGLLCGWSARGDRPAFRLVTGISTGALIAPMAFLGPKYDWVLEEAYTRITIEDIFESRGLTGVLTDDAYADSEPLGELIARWMTADAIAAVAREHRRGRRLLVATFNLEAQRPVVWDLGAIAASERPEAPALFRTVMLASCSIPGALEPQYIDVEVDGVRYQEMHVDGGTYASMFLWGLQPPAGERRPVRLFVVNNGWLEPVHQTMPPRFSAIAVRALLTLLKSVSLRDTWQLYDLAKRHGMAFHLASIPPEHPPPPLDREGNEHMVALFRFGRERGERGDAWQREPPYWSGDPRR